MSDLTSAIRQVCEEKGLSYEAVIETIESALAAAYRKDFGQKNQNIKVEFDPETGKSKVYDVKTVVEDQPEEILAEGEENDVEEKIKKDGAKTKDERSEMKDEKDIKKIITDDSSTSSEPMEEEKRFNSKTDLQIKDAKLLKKTAKIGDVIKTKLEIPSEFGRMAAQTAKQVIIQRLREAEREMIFDEFKDKEREVVSGVVQRREGRIVLVDLGKAVGILPPEEQIMGERYNPGERIKIYIKEVRSGHKGAEVVLSRISDEILRKVFYLEIPEISNGLVELKAVAREAGSRSKVAVWTDSENVDPVGSCVGQRGSRIQTIIQELGGEKVDIIEWDENLAKFIENALSPAKVISISLDEETKKATVKVVGDQLSLAIGKSGQNARLAAKLTGWGIDIVEAEKETGEKANADEKVEANKAEEKDLPASDNKTDETKKDNPAAAVEETNKKEDKPKKRKKKTDDVKQ